MSSVKETIAEIEKDYDIKLNPKGYKGPLGLKKLEAVCEQIKADVHPTNTDEKQEMIDELKNDYGKDLNLADYEGPHGYGTLKGYYEGIRGAASEASEPRKKATKTKVTPPA